MSDTVSHQERLDAARAERMTEAAKAITSETMTVIVRNVMVEPLSFEEPVIQEVEPGVFEFRFRAQCLHVQADGVIFRGPVRTYPGSTIYKG